jgi:hypothetical protein
MPRHGFQEKGQAMNIKTYYITYSDAESPCRIISLRGSEASANQLIDKLVAEGCMILEVRAVV